MKILTELSVRQRFLTRVGTFFIGIVPVILSYVAYCNLFFITFGLYALLLMKPEWVYVFAKTFIRDILAVKIFVGFLANIVSVQRKQWSVARIFQENSKEYLNQPCFKLGPETWTYADVDSYSNKIGGYFKSKHFKHGDTVALIMETRIEYPGIWLGLSKIGVISAWVNYNLRKGALLHSIRISNAKAIIISTELIEALEEIMDEDCIKNLTIYQHSDYKQRNCDLRLIKGAIDLYAEMEAQPEVDLSNDIKVVKPDDTLCYIYTSGTTGMPKAAIITNSRYFLLACACKHMTGMTKNDRIYSPLPIYHSAGGIVSVGSSMLFGTCVVLRKKFSVTHFFKDIRDYECNIVQYIGEMCRYLLTAPHSSDDANHNIRLMFGNGMRPEIWKQFITRYNIQNIVESYAATEGNIVMSNITGHVGAIGFMPAILTKYFPTQFVKCDESTGEPIRDAEGYCIRCKPGEPGLVLGKILKKRPTNQFHGYVDRGATKSKILRDVFTKGDEYFNSGDIVVRDILGYIYFKDRTGDTYRWRSENVSTAEVEATILGIVGLADCVVYGVEVPHTEGRAGMAAIADPEHKIDISYLSVALRGSLPSYAQPLFLRFLDEIPRTNTYKMKKRELMQQSYNIHFVKDPIYFLHRDGIYRVLDHKQYEMIMNGEAGL